MAIQDDEAARTAELRRRAEDRAARRPLPLPQEADAPLSETFLGTLHELQVHQIELELQNEELRLAQGDLEQARARYFELFDQAPVGYCTLSGQDLILEANDTAARMLGRPRPQLAGQPLATYIHPDDQVNYHLQRSRFLAEGTPFTCDLRLLPKVGPALWASLAVKAAAGQKPTSGQGPLAWVVLVDLSERKRAEEERARLEAQVRHAHRLESIGRLAGGMAHDFNNLLGAMVGNLDLLRLELPRGTALARLDSLDQLVARAADQVARIMTFAGKGRGRFQALDLNRQVETMAGLLRSSLPPQVSLRLEPGAGLPTMEGDPSQVQQVVLNLVLNAAEALGADGGTVTLGTRLEQVTPQDCQLRHPGQALKPGPHLALTVADGGPGMAPEVRELIFDPYFSTRRPGRGLGLPVVHGVLVGHRGGIRVDSGEGRGTRVTVLFPARPEPAGTGLETAAREPALAMAPPGAGRVLLVEDEEALRAVAAQSLRRLGFEALEAGDGLEALRLFEANRGALRLVLLDLTMPNMDGEQTYRELRRAGAEVPIVLTSGFGAEEALRPFRGRGVAGFLAKPYRLGELAGVLQAALDRTGARSRVLWERAFETGHPALDASHQDLLRAYNQIVLALAHGGPGEPAQALARRIRQGEAAFTAPVLDCLQDWVVCHIQGEGQALARYLKPGGH